MDFSSDPWTWILPALAAGAILVWFVLGLISRGLDFYRAELEAERGARRDEHPRTRSSRSCVHSTAVSPRSSTAGPRRCLGLGRCVEVTRLC